MEASISFSRKTLSYWPRPRPRSHSPISMAALFGSEFGAQLDANLAATGRRRKARPPDAGRVAGNRVIELVGDILGEKRECPPTVIGRKLKVEVQQRIALLHRHGIVGGTGIVTAARLDHDAARHCVIANRLHIFQPHGAGPFRAE